MVNIIVKYYRSEIVKDLQSYDLRVVVESATDMPEEIFVLQRTVPQPGGTAEDRFICLADPVDLEEYPVGSPDPGNEMPYLRVKEVTLRFRSMDLLDEAKTLMDQDIQQLVKSLQIAQTLPLYDEVTYAYTG